MENTNNTIIQATGKTLRTTKRKTVLFVVLAALLLIAVVAVVLTFSSQHSDLSSDIDVISVPTLQKIVDVNELSTFTAVYNGVAKAFSKTDANEIDYYVSYDAKVNAGIDVKQIEISIDQENKRITIQLPEVYITDINVKTSSLDFIFINEDANTNTVVAEAYKICEEDVRAESELQEEIKALARQNAVNTIRALTKPFIEQLDIEYILDIQ